MDYPAIAADAALAIAEAGTVWTIRRRTPIGPDYAPTGLEDTDYPATVVLTSFRQHEIDGTRVLAADKKALVAADVALSPQMSDLLVSPDGVSLAIVDVEAVKPAGVVVLWKLQVRC